MIPQIKEINFPEYATLHQATVSLQEMGERTITTQVRIDGDIAPDYEGWELEFKGERFILPTRVPQATKDNTTRNSLTDLTFTSWAVGELKRYFFMSMSEIESGVAIADQYKASVILPFESFVQLFNKVLRYYFGTKIRLDLFNPGVGAYSANPVSVEINYTYLWDVLQKFYELFGVRWRIEYEDRTSAYVIKVGYPSPTIEEHEFEYGYKGGLLKFERQVQDDSIKNILLGRGGEKNLPYRYFKRVDPQNDSWASDPDAIPELANIYFDRLHDINFRWYVRGWMQNPHRDTSWEQEGYTYPTYDITDNSQDPNAAYYWAYQRGRTDEVFNPVEYVADEYFVNLQGEIVERGSILKYGEHWGALDDNDTIYPTIQGVERYPIGRVDEVVAVSEIITDDRDAYARSAARERGIAAVSKVTNYFGAYDSFTNVLYSEEFTIPQGQTGNILYSWVQPFNGYTGDLQPRVDTTGSSIVAVNTSTEEELAAAGLPAGTYRLKITLHATNDSDQSITFATYGFEAIRLKTSAADLDAWKPTFDIWVKNIWDTTQGANESDEAYAIRVWQSILGDRVGNEAKIVFSDGFMSISSDYEFVIAAYPVVDRSKTITERDSSGVYQTYQSEWKITLYKSSAEFDATGLFVPNAQSGGAPSAGDHFFFTGIDMPFLYVVWAEENLNAYKTNALDGLSEVTPTWVITLDKVRAHTLEAEDLGSLLADRLTSGAQVRIKDKRFTGGSTLTLYVQSITYTWNEPSEGSPYLVPDIEVVLSDKVTAVESPVKTLQNDVDIIQSSYVKTSDIEAAIRRVASPLFLKKTGESDSSASPTTFSSRVTSKSFRPGDVGGAGWGYYEDEGGQSILELDKLIVRKEMRVNSLVANQIAYEGGKQIISAASIECAQVVETEDSYLCYFDQKQGSVANLFTVNDIAMGQVFDANNVETRYYKALVTEVGENYIELSKDYKVGDGAPEAGDVIIQYGNTVNPNRQYVIVRDVIGGGHERMLSGLSGLQTNGNEYYFAGRDSVYGPRWFVGNPLGDYAQWENGVLNIRGRIAVYKQAGQYVALDQFIADNEYLHEALAQSTLVEGGLVLTSLIQLGQVENDQFRVYSGVNGLMDTEALGDGIAAWYGGPMVDHEDSASATSYAKSLFRFDGSGYLASGNIAWNSAGEGHIPGISWEGNNIVISGDVKLASVSGDTVTSMITLLRQLNDWFGEDANGDIYVKKHTVNGVQVGRNFYSFGGVTAGGSPSGGGGGGGGATQLNDLDDVTISSAGRGQVLYHNGTIWGNIALTPALVFGTSGTPSRGQTMVWDGSAWAYGSAGAVSSVVGQTGDITAAQIGSSLALIGYAMPSTSQWNNKQDKLTFDSTPTEGSDNPVTSDGIFSALAAKPDTDTKNTAGNNTSPNKMYLVGVMSTSGNYAQTYRHANVYATNGNLYATKFNNYILADACAKGVSTEVASGDTNLITSGAVHTALSAMSNYVTTDTAQSISGQKTFEDNLYASHIYPREDKKYTLGHGTAFWKAVYAEDIHVKSFVAWKKAGETYIDDNGNTQTADGGFNFYTRDANDVWANMLLLKPDGVAAGGLLYPNGNFDLGAATRRWKAAYINTVNTTAIESSSAAIYVRVTSGGALADVCSFENSGMYAYMNIIPGGAVNDTISLGRPDRHWQALYLKNGGEIYSGSTKVLSVSTSATTAHKNIVPPSSASSIQLGTSGSRWSNVYSAAGNFSSYLTASKGVIFGNGDGNGIFVSSSATQVVYFDTSVIHALKPIQVTGTVYPDLDNTRALGTSDYHWSKVFAKGLYPDVGNDSAVNIRYDSTIGGFRVTGNLIVSGQVVAGQTGSGSSEFPVSVSGSIIPTTGGLNLGSDSSKFGTLYVDTIGNDDVGRCDIYADALDANDFSCTYFSCLHPEYITEWVGLANYLSGTGGSSVSGETLGVHSGDLDKIIAGRISTITTGAGTSDSAYKYVFHIVTVRGYASGNTKYYNIYVDGPTRLRIGQVGSSNNSWRIYTSW